MTQPWKDLGSNIIKLEGYGLYVTVIDSDVYICPMVPHSGLPELDPDKNIEWTKLEDPDNQMFLNLVNAKFGTSFVMTQYDKSMNIHDIKSHIVQQKKIKAAAAAGKGNGPLTESEARWLVKNMREKNK